MTMVVGRNGTKKSLLLRALLDAFLGNEDFRHGIRPAIKTAVKFNSDDAVRDRAIAISGTPFDRFPRQNRFIALASSGKYDNVNNYYYIGLSTANGATGTTHNVRTLANLLFHAARTDEGLATAVMRVLTFLNFNSEVYVVLKRSSAINFSRTEALASEGIVSGKFSFDNFHAQLHLKTISGTTKAVARSLGNILEKMKNAEYKNKLISSLTKMPSSVAFRFNKKGMQLFLNSKIEMHVADIIALLDAGILTASHIACNSKTSDRDNASAAGRSESSRSSDTANAKGRSGLVAETDMSSGQWQLFSSMLGLALTVADNSLVVIDEPENSLHPDWQRSYIQLLDDVIAHRKGCHVVVATHSPLIASGVDGKNGNAVRMMRAPTDSLLGTSEPLPMAFGWDASDVYNEVFGVSAPRASRFTESADRALALIREGSFDSEELAPLIAELTEAAKLFPKTDSMGQVISAMAHAYKTKGGL
ncbi:AAA family ATPase [Paraburkholderia dipogonis]|uniref:AAA family ATPase n=1 Tax=Paraburkholderia dipogonis TaxID=1211383 RepID=UPI0038BB91B8